MSAPPVRLPPMPPGMKKLPPMPPSMLNKDNSNAPPLPPRPPAGYGNMPPGPPMPPGSSSSSGGGGGGPGNYPMPPHQQGNPNSSYYNPNQGGNDGGRGYQNYYNPNNGPYGGGGGGGEYGHSNNSDVHAAPYNSPNFYASQGGGGGPGRDYGGGGGDYYRGDRDRYGGRPGNRNGGGGGGGGGGPRMREATNTVWVGNLSHQDEQRLRDIFSEFGVVMQVATHPDRGFCFIHYRHVSEAQNAVRALSQRGTLGEARFNYSKMFTYTEAEMAPDYDPRSAPAPSAAHHGPDGRDGGGRGGGGGLDRRGVGTPTPSGHNAIPPNNVLYVANVPPFISEDKLRDFFSSYGEITRLVRLEKGNVAFVHFATEEQCTNALELLGPHPPIEGGVRLSINYGRGHGEGGGSGGAGAPGASSVPLTDDGIPVNETPTNVIYLGQLPTDVTEQDLIELFKPFEGFINAKHVESSNIGFGHFVTADDARVARISLSSLVLKGAPVRISFGKQKHHYTIADRYDVAGGGALTTTTTTAANPDDGSSADPNGSGAGALVLPSRGGDGGGLVSAPGDGAAGAMSTEDRILHNIYNNERRPPPTGADLDTYLRTLMATPFNMCGGNTAVGSRSGASVDVGGGGISCLSASQVLTIVKMVDSCIDAETAAVLKRTLFLYMRLQVGSGDGVGGRKAAHVINVITKRLKQDPFAGDPHKKLIVCYTVSEVLLTLVAENNKSSSSNGGGGDSKARVELGPDVWMAYLLLLLVVAGGQSSSGTDRLTTILEHLVRKADMVEGGGAAPQRQEAGEENSNSPPSFKEQWVFYLEEIRSRVKAERDLYNLLNRKKRK